MLQALRTGEEWRVGGGGGGGKGSWSRAGAGAGEDGLEKWSAVKASGLNWGGAATVGRGGMGMGGVGGRRGGVAVLSGGAVGGREGWF